MNTFDPTKPVQTRDGRKVRILCRDFKSPDYSIIGLIERGADDEQVQSWTNSGRAYTDSIVNPDDLINIPAEPKLRAWKPEEVPVGCLLRVIPAVAKSKEWHHYMVSTIICASYISITYCGGTDGMKHQQPLWFLNNLEHSIDGGKTWLACGVLEAAQ